ncbi:glycosyltransferase family 20 domain-containing protein [Ditylenchus destructor]|nr:glycosyltransferase family 20 domain-containing protein [Ditylenchus destructor]
MTAKMIVENGNKDNNNHPAEDQRVDSGHQTQQQTSSSSPSSCRASVTVIRPRSNGQNDQTNSDINRGGAEENVNNPSVSQTSGVVPDQPFRRTRLDSRAQLLMAAAAAANAKLQQASVTEAVVQAVRSSQQSNTESTRKNVVKTLKKLGAEADENWTLEKIIEAGLEHMPNLWKKRDSNSEIAFQGLLAILEYCLQHSFDSTEYVEKLVNNLGYHTFQFWKAAIPYIFDSDMQHGTKYRDALLFTMALYDVNTGRGGMRGLYAAVPGLRKCLLGFRAKRFGEQYHHLQQRRRTASTASRASLRDSNDSLANAGPVFTLNGGNATNEPLPSSGEEDESDQPDAQRRKKRSMSIDSTTTGSDGHAQGLDDATSFASGGLAQTHFQQRVINVSNAPPVSLKRDPSGDWGIKQGSGGLVSCVDPVMSVNPENMWLANLGMNIDKCKLKSNEFLNVMDDVSHLAPTTNTLGLPLMRQTLADVLFHVIADDDIKEENETATKKQVREEMSLLGVLNNYNRDNYKLNPVVVQESDYNVYYGGISNGLLWPALHNLQEYIVSDYDDSKTLREHWCSYVRVNYQFAIDAVRNSRPQDFIWIHDYHLMLTGMIMQSLDSNLEIGFFLHIPFLPPDNFFTKYKIAAFPILRGLLRFTKVGFQTHRDRANFLSLVSEHLPTAKIVHDQNLDISLVTYQGWSCSLGVFPVSIKNEDFLKIAKDSETIKQAHDIRKKIFGENPLSDARLFFSVERFDYTKGIKEKLLAYRRYYEKYPDRLGKDVLFQVAVTNRRSVDAYRIYQDECIDLAEQMNKDFASDKHPNWKPIIFETDGLQRQSLIAHYLAMDIGVVTPKKDGMNLVVKEMLVCNPLAGIVLSTGAGSEIQFTMGGLHPEGGDCTYHRVEDVYDVERYADAFYAAATESEESRAVHGHRLNEFIMANDIERWSAAFLDPAWSHVVIRQVDVVTLEDFNKLMQRSRDVRRQIVERVLKGIPIRSHFAISLSNAKESLTLACKQGSTIIHLKPSLNEDELSGVDKVEFAHFDIKTEIEEFEKDLNFLKFIQSDDVNNVEQFVNSLQEYHPVSIDKFREEVMAVVDLFTDADHFHYFFTDRDGTLKSYSCSYSASIQPAYSGVIQAQFARRCAQTCAIVTTAPLMRIGVLDVNTIPEGYYYIGASAGRDWFIEPGNKFKDQSIPDQDLELLDSVFSAISDLLDDPKFKHFNWVGSGLQKHYGHVTVGHQDAFGSVPTQQVKTLDKKIRDIVNDIDPHEQTLSIQETDTDVKIFIKSESGGIFDKGHGIKLLVEHTKCDLKAGNILVCGDSATDVPMLRYCLENNPQGVFTVWVTTNEELRQKVKELCESYDNHNFVFVSCPEVLLGGMAQATIREISISVSRPRFSQDDCEAGALD